MCHHKQFTKSAYVSIIKFSEIKNTFKKTISASNYPITDNTVNLKQAFDFQQNGIKYIKACHFIALLKWILWRLKTNITWEGLRWFPLIKYFTLFRCINILIKDFLLLIRNRINEGKLFLICRLKTFPPNVLTLKLVKREKSRVKKQNLFPNEFGETISYFKVNLQYWSFKLFPLIRRKEFKLFKRKDRWVIYKWYAVFYANFIF